MINGPAKRPASDTVAYHFVHNELDNIYIYTNHIEPVKMIFRYVIRFNEENKFKTKSTAFSKYSE